MSKYVPRGPIMHRHQPPPAQKLLDQLVSYTQDVYEFLGIEFDAKGRRNYRTWDDGYPTGHCTHFTASNAAVSGARPLGRIPVLLRRFARRSGTPGVHFITWDGFMPMLDDIREKYPVFEQLNCEVFCLGLDVAFYHGNALNGFCVGNELRNLGKVHKRDDGSWGWGKGGAIDYSGRQPVRVRELGWYEPFTRQQIEAVILTNRWMRKLYPMEPSRFLGHLHVTSNRTDPFPHFPIQLVREAVFFDDRPLSEMDWLLAYNRDQGDFLKRNDEYMEDWLFVPPPDGNDDEDLKHYWDPGLDSDMDLEDLWARKGEAAEFSDDDHLYGDDEGVTSGDVVEAKKALYHLGYYPFAWGPSFTAGETAEFEWTLKMFQNRWVRRKGKRWIHLLKDTGKLDESTVKKLNVMLRQYDLLPD